MGCFFGNVLIQVNRLNGRKYRKGDIMAKSLFVCVSKHINNHVGEEYDSILEVEDSPTTETIQDWANRITGRIRKLWHEQVKPDDPNHVAINAKVVCHLDGPTPYHAILANMQIRMKADESVVIDLPYAKEPEVTDPEALELLKKLDGK
jgi:hypothetical protein